MTEYTTADHICLHLLSMAEDAGTDPEGATTEGLLDALGVGERRITGHFGVISGLSELEERGLIEARPVAVAGHDGGRTVYELTEAGRQHARTVAAELENREVTVRTADGRERTRLGEVVDRLDGSLADAVTRLRGDTLVLDEDVEDPIDPEAMPFVGREADLAWLDERFERVRSGVGEATAGDASESVVRVEGQPGVGKTRLVSEFADRVEDGNGDALVLFGQCRREGERPYGAVLDAVVDLPPDERGRIPALLTAAGPDRTPPGESESENENEDESESENESDADAGAADGEEPPEPGSPDELRERRQSLFDAVADELATVTAERPVVLALDDAQWVDRPTALLVAHLASELAAEPFLVVATSYPPETRGSDALADALSEYDLAAEKRELDLFGRAATDELVARLVGTRGVPESFVERVHEHTGGNPLFVAESVTRMLEDGVVQPELDYFPASSDDLPVPETVEDAITTRLDRLDDRTLRLLETAALVGTVVPVDVLEAASGLSTAAVRERVAVLVESRVWTRADDDAVRFVSDVVRETIREEVPGERRQAIHGRVADAYGRLDDRGVEGTATAARHYDRAGANEAAVEAALAAAERAIDVYAHEVAIDACERAVDLARATGDDGTVAEALELLGDTYETTGEFDEAARCFGFVRERTDDPETVQRMWTREGRLETKTGNFDRARVCFEEALSVHREHDRDAPAELADTLHNLAIVAVKQADFEAAKERFEAVVDRFRDLGDDVGAARTLGNLGVVERKLGNYGAAEDAHRRSLDVFREHDERNDEANALGNLGLVATKRGDLAAAREWYRECLDRKREVEEPRGQARALHNLGTVERKDGDLSAAREYYQRSLDIDEETGDRHGEAQSHQHLGTVEREAGNDDAAREYYRRALETYREVGDRSREAETLGEFGVLAWREGDHESATDYLERCLDAYEETGEVVERSEFRRTLGAVQVSRGDLDAGRENLDAALSVLADADSPLAEVTVLRRHVEAELDRGDPDRARELADRAWDRFQSVDAGLGAEGERIRTLRDRLGSTGDDAGANSGP